MSEILYHINEKYRKKKGVGTMNNEAKIPSLALICEGDSTLPALAAAIARGASEAGAIDLACCNLISDGAEAAQALLERCDGCCLA